LFPVPCPVNEAQQTTGSRGRDSIRFSPSSSNSPVGRQNACAERFAAASRSWLFSQPILNLPVPQPFSPAWSIAETVAFRYLCVLPGNAAECSRCRHSHCEDWTAAPSLLLENGPTGLIRAVWLARVITATIEYRLDSGFIGTITAPESRSPRVSTARVRQHLLGPELSSLCCVRVRKQIVAQEAAEVGTPGDKLA
jgi:hypothetical protein